MFNPFNRVRGARPSRLFRPGLETLEGRDCPSYLGVQPNQQLWYLLNTAPVIHTPVAASPDELIGGGGGGSGGGAGSGNVDNPSLTLSVIYNGRTSVTLSGTVTDPAASPAGLTVTFTGVVAGTAVTDSNGNFTLTTNAACLGVVDATTVDSLGNNSNTASVTLTAPAPVINDFTAVEGPGQIFTFSGTVTDQTPGGLSVGFGGIPALVGQSATTNGGGAFSLTVQLQDNGSDNGTAWAQTADWWGLISNQATTSVYVST
jgi:hypothetical protein